MSFGSENMREVYENTRVVRRPTYGIVRGYHELPYVCLGTALDGSHGSMRVRGTIHVSPRFIIRPSHYSAKYEEIFGEDNVEDELCGRVFGFLGFARKPVECSMEGFEVENLRESVDQALSDVLDHIERYEDITTGVVVTPNTRYYPVSVERLIAAVLEDEFSV